MLLFHRHLHPLNKLSIVLILLSFIGCSEKEPAQQSYEISSPDENITANFWLSEDGIPQYSITAKDAAVLETSTLGVSREDADFSNNLKLTDATDVNTIKDDYELLVGKQRKINYEANEQTFTLEHADGEKMEIVFRLSNDGVAFRYHFPGESDDTKKISKEHTTFNFLSGTRGWLQPIAEVNTGFANTNPSYEEHYLQDIPLTTASPTGAGWVYPALFQQDDTWVLVTEAGLDRNYCATRLLNDTESGVFSIGFPHSEEKFPDGEVNPHSTLPWQTPWRIITIGDLGTIVTSTLGTDLAAPAMEMASDFIQPGIASWSWVILKDESVNYDDQLRFIDYAADMQWEYTLVDADWDRNIGYEKTAELAQYAAEKGVGLLVWYNSSGDWNETIMTPKSKLLTRESRRNEFSQLQEMGVRGIKVDFFGGDGQSMMNYYQDLFEDAADYELLVNCHGSTLPRGWQRTYPNMMTMEAIKGMEFITFDQGNADLAPNHAAMLPFTRNVFDPMDYTPMSLRDLPGIARKTTAAHELALPIIFTSGIQHMAEIPEGMAAVPEYVKDFLTDFPVIWEDSRFIEGFPGKLAVIARESKKGWYIGGINGEEKAKKLALDFSMIGGTLAEALLIKDGEEHNSFRQENLQLSSENPFEIELKGNGGFVIFIPNE